jgi:hypothetical protein
MSHSANINVAKSRHPVYSQVEAGETLRASDIQKYMDRVATELANSSAKVADSSKQMWQKYSDCRLRDFAHSQ